MIRAVLADTGPLYAAADEDDADHERSLLQMEQLQRTGRIVLLAYPILLEAYSLVLKRFGSAAALRRSSHHRGAAATPSGRRRPESGCRTRRASEPGLKLVRWWRVLTRRPIGQSRQG